MANPQAEDGHTKIANEIMDVLMRIHLSDHERRILDCILRKTYGWNKKTDRISYSQFAEATMIARRHVYRSLVSLKQRNIITVSGTGYNLEYGFQKNYELWDKIDTNSGADLTPIQAPIQQVFDTNSGADLTPIQAPIQESKSAPLLGAIGASFGKSDTNPGAEFDTNPGAHKSNKAFIQKHYTKAIVGANNETFEDYANKLKQEFNDLNFSAEMEKFKLYWSEGRRQLKRPKLALRNWMEHARRFKQGNGERSNTHQQQPLALRSQGHTGQEYTGPGGFESAAE